MGQADRDDMADMLDAIGGDIPAVERSSIALDGEGASPAPPKPVAEMSLVEQLQA